MHERIWSKQKLFEIISNVKCSIFDRSKLACHIFCCRMTAYDREWPRCLPLEWNRSILNLVIYWGQSHFINININLFLLTSRPLHLHSKYQNQANLIGCTNFRHWNSDSWWLNFTKYESRIIDRITVNSVFWNYYSHITRKIFAVYATVDLISPFLVDMQF